MCCFFLKKRSRQRAWRKLCFPSLWFEKRVLGSADHSGRMGTSAPTKGCRIWSRGRCLIGPWSIASQTTWRRPGVQQGRGEGRRPLFVFFPGMERTKDPRGTPQSDGRPAARSSMSAYPRTPLRGTLSWGGSAHPARVVQLIDSASAPLPLAGQSWEGCPAGREKRAWCKQL